MIVFTSATASYLPQVAVLAKSVRQHHPSWHFVLVLVERDSCAAVDLIAEIDEVVLASSLQIPNFEPWVFGHDVVEACTAVKGAALLALLNRGDDVLYIDPDVRLYGPLLSVVETLERASIILTPHLRLPNSVPEMVSIREVTQLSYGTFNLGFLGVRNDSVGLDFAKWWSDRLYLYCFDDPASGLFTDQKWIDLVPGLFPALEVLRQSSLNYATWNAHEVPVTIRGDEYFVEGNPLEFVHFSGWSSGAHRREIEHHLLFGTAFDGISRAYEHLVKEERKRLFTTIPAWSYGFFTTGEAIEKEGRRDFWSSWDKVSAPTDPFIRPRKLQTRRSSPRSLLNLAEWDVEVNHPWVVMDAHVGNLAPRMKLRDLAVGEGHAVLEGLLVLARNLAHVDKPKILLITHGGGGGTDLVADSTARNYALSNLPIVLSTDPQRPGSGYLVNVLTEPKRTEISFLPTEEALLIDFLSNLGISRIEIHHVLGLEPIIGSVIDALGVSIHCVLHDGYLLGSEISVDFENLLPPRNAPVVDSKIGSRVLERADAVFAVSEPLRQHAQTLLGSAIQVELFELRETAGQVVESALGRAANENVVGFIGDMSEVKGGRIVRELLLLENLRNWLAMGWGNFPATLRSLFDVWVEDPGPRLLQSVVQQRPTIIVLPLYRETFSLLIGELKLTGIPLMVPDTALMRERLNGHPGVTFVKSQQGSVWRSQLEQIVGRENMGPVPEGYRHQGSSLPSVSGKMSGAHPDNLTFPDTL